MCVVGGGGALLLFCLSQLVWDWGIDIVGAILTIMIQALQREVTCRI